jgi:hypothetical protein
MVSDYLVSNLTSSDLHERFSKTAQIIIHKPLEELALGYYVLMHTSYIKKKEQLAKIMLRKWNN